MIKTFKPLGERLLLKRAESNKEKGGILLPEKFQGYQEHYHVMAVGTGVHDIKEGDMVIAVPDGAEELEIQEHGKCLLVQERRIMGVLENE